MNFNKQQALDKARSLAKDFDSESAKEFSQKYTHKSWYSDFVLLYEMITDKNFSLDGNVYLAIAGALAYVVMPIDIIPDFIPGVGFIDDVFVVGIVMKSISDEIKRFKIYKGEV